MSETKKSQAYASFACHKLFVQFLCEGNFLILVLESRWLPAIIHKDNAIMPKLGINTIMPKSGMPKSRSKQSGQVSTRMNAIMPKPGITGLQKLQKAKVAHKFIYLCFTKINYT
jgi:hypothetical protein